MLQTDSARTNRQLSFGALGGVCIAGVDALLAGVARGREGTTI
jgi:hypothetical protein